MLNTVLKQAIRLHATHESRLTLSLDSPIPATGRSLDPETRFFPVRGPGPSDALMHASNGPDSRFRGKLGKPATNAPYRDDATSRHKNEFIMFITKSDVTYSQSNFCLHEMTSISLHFEEIISTAHQYGTGTHHQYPVLPEFASPSFCITATNTK